MNENTRYHLCLTHSPLTSIVFEAAMKLHGVPAWLIKSISRRSVSPVGSGLMLDDLSDIFKSAYRNFDRHLYTQAKAQLGDYLEELTNGKLFLAYIPHTRQILYQETISHPNCAGYYLIEEGFTSMAWLSHQTLRYSFLKRLQHTLRKSWSGSCFSIARDMFDTTDPRFCGAISISHQAFVGMPSVLNVSSGVPCYTRQGELKRLYVILDTSYLHRGIRWQDYEEALVGAIVEEYTLASRILVKFHFADNRVSERFISLGNRVAAAGGGQLELLDHEFSVEAELTGDDCLLFGVSSLGYYAAIFGGKVKCCASEIKGLDVEQWMANGLLPQDFAEVVGLTRKARNLE